MADSKPIAENEYADTIQKSWYKQLLLDIEERNIDVRLVTLDYLTTVSSLLYGNKNSKNEEVKEKRRKLSLRLLDLTRICNRSPVAYLAILQKEKVTPSATTLSLVQLEKEGKDFSNKTPKTPIKKETDISVDFVELRLTSPNPPKQAIVHSPPSFQFTPTRPSKKMATSTPPRTIALNGDTSSFAGMTQSSSTSLMAGWDKPKGSQYNPDIFFFQETFQGKHSNGYNVYQPPQLISSKVSYKGIVAFKKVDPSNILDHSAHLPLREYMFALASHGLLSDEQAYMPAILFKAPLVEAGDWVVPKSIVSIAFPCAESKQQVSKLQAKIRSDDAERWYYTLGIFDMGDFVFDNRIFSDNDSIIKGVESVPPAATVVGSEKTMHWHIIWRVAFKETAEALEGEATESIEDIIRKRRAGK